MTKNRLSYYSLYLKKYLQEVGHPQKDDDEFITMRADAAAEEGEKSARQGLPPALAEEQAMAVLLEGLTDIEPSDEDGKTDADYQRMIEDDEQLRGESGYYVSDEIPDNNETLED